MENLYDNLVILKTFCKTTDHLNSFNALVQTFIKNKSFSTMDYKSVVENTVNLLLNRDTYSQLLKYSKGDIKHLDKNTSDLVKVLFGDIQEYTDEFDDASIQYELISKEVLFRSSNRYAKLLYDILEAIYSQGY